MNAILGRFRLSAVTKSFYNFEDQNAAMTGLDMEWRKESAKSLWEMDILWIIKEFPCCSHSVKSNEGVVLEEFILFV